MNRLVAGVSLQGEAQEQLQGLRTANLDIGKQIVIYGRHAVAHGDEKIAIDPDIVGERALLHRLMPIVAGLACYTIENHFGVSTRRTYYQKHDYGVAGFAGKLSDENRTIVHQSVGLPSIAIESPIRKVTIGLRHNRYAALTGLIVLQATIYNGGVNLRLKSQDDLVNAIIRFDLIERRLYFDVERGMQVTDDGSAASADYAADVSEFILGLVGNGELHAWDGESDELLGRQNPNIPMNIDPSETHRLLTARIEELRARAASRREADPGTNRAN